MRIGVTYEAGIRLYGGVTGNADEAVNNYITGNLDYNPDIHCMHHEHGCTGNSENCQAKIEM